VLRIVRRVEPLVPPAEAGRFRALVEAGFRTRRRSLRAALAPVVPERAFKRAARELGFDATAAARDLDLHQWAALAGALEPDRGRTSAVRPAR
jgi:16S rRNA A1518/A1519 N6-dimethyltransferase RsmA/KsgA/DIM1 with predicted DNA glycosylase/AP lyase activity